MYSQPHHRHRPTHQTITMSLIIFPLLLILQSIHSSYGSNIYKLVPTTMAEKEIRTRAGKMLGVEVSFNTKLRTVEWYKGLHYADGGMRFMPPKAPKYHWNTTVVAISYQPACPQPGLLPSEAPSERLVYLRNITPFLTKQTEDCLNLNLYVPKQEWNETKMAVMVFIHGESYDTGTGNAYDGSVLSSFGGVIVVTLNYRLGVLGFLSTGNQYAMGNYALVDITQALLWLKKNIGNFNGDPNRVTLVGHGTGASLVNILMLSSQSRNKKKQQLFHRGIIQSGSAGSTWSVSYDPKWCTHKLARNVNCSHHIGDDEALVKCLRSRSYETLVNSAPRAPKYFSCFAPSVDSWYMFPSPVEKLVEERKSDFAALPVMFGITKNEAYSYLKQHEIDKGISSARKSQIIRTYVQNVFKYHRQKIYEILDHHYTDWARPEDSISNRNNILELLSDGQYVAPLIQMANEHSETADTYLYSFPYSTEANFNEDVTGIHGDELPYVFGAPLIDGNPPFPEAKYTDVEKMLTEAVMTYWTNFAKTGNPNFPRNQTSGFSNGVENRFKSFKWPKYKKDSQEYLPISRDPVIGHHYRAQKLALWHELIPKINRDDGTSDRASHLLKHWDDPSSFDEYGHLVPNFNDHLFPSPPPMPPTRPTSNKFSSDQTMTTQPDTNNKDTLTLDPDNTYGGNGNNNNGSSGTGTGMTSESVKGGNESSRDSETAGAGIPLSIVIAIGGSLLLINLLIFAALCYQRERIRKMRIGKPDDRPRSGLHHYEDDDHKFDVKRVDGPNAHVQSHNLHSDRNSYAANSPVPTAAECMSLMSSAGSTAVNNGANCSTPKNGITHIHNPSPQPSNHSRSRGNSQPRTTPPTDGVNCSYTAVPTDVTSPIHRASRPGSSSNDGSPSVTLGLVGGDGGGRGGGGGGGPRINDCSGGVGGDICGDGMGNACYVNSKPRLDNNVMSGIDRVTRPPPYNSVGSGGGDVGGGGSGSSGSGGGSAFVPTAVKNKSGPYSRQMSNNSTGSYGDTVSGGAGGGGGVNAAGVGMGGNGGMTTFGPGYSGVGRSREGPAINSPGSNGGGVGGGGSGDAVYKTINKSGNSTNAVTIV